jgi:hypothetical protein
MGPYVVPDWNRGTAVFIAIWAITRVAGNPITGRAGQLSQNGIIVETMQVAFIVLVIAIILYQKRKKD